MSLLKRIGGSGPLEGATNGATAAAHTATATNGQQTHTQPAPATNVLPRQTAQMPQTGRLGAGTEEARRGGGMSSQENMLELKNRVQQKLIAELDPKLDLTKTD